MDDGSDEVLRHVAPALDAVLAALEDGVDHTHNDFGDKGWTRPDHPSTFTINVKTYAHEQGLALAEEAGLFHRLPGANESIRVVTPEGYTIWVQRPAHGGGQLTWRAAESRPEKDFRRGNGTPNLLVPGSGPIRNLILVWDVRADGTAVGLLYAPADVDVFFWTVVVDRDVLAPLVLEQLPDDDSDAGEDRVDADGDLYLGMVGVPLDDTDLVRERDDEVPVVLDGDGDVVEDDLDDQADGDVGTEGP